MRSSVFSSFPPYAEKRLIAGDSLIGFGLRNEGKIEWIRWLKKYGALLGRIQNFREGSPRNGPPKTVPCRGFWGASSPGQFSKLTLHATAEPAVRAAVKTKLSYQNDTIIAFFFVADKNKDNATCYSIRGLDQTPEVPPPLDPLQHFRSAITFRRSW